MIPRLAEGGASFKGAAAYYLADKRQAGEAVRTTSERVAWTYALNLPTQDPDRAWRMMAHTAMAAPALKKAAGIKATGRKLTKPVMPFSLSWSPDEKPPAPHEMLEAAQSALAALGLDEHQALIICHNDTAHPHVHVLVNRVHPVTGVAHPGSKTKLALSAWAETYEQGRGRIFCDQRTENNSRRRDRRKVERAEKVSRPQWEAGQSDPEEAAIQAATNRESFGDQAALERAGQGKRLDEAATFHAARRAGRNAIRDRYQAALRVEQRPGQAAHHARVADALLQRDPSLGLQGLTRDRSTFTRQDLVRHVGRHTATVADFQAVLARLEASPELVALGPDSTGRQRFTTREFQGIERRMEDHARAIHARQGREVRPLWPKGLALSKDQDAALRHIVGNKGLAAIVGYAGTGKSTLLAAARRSWEAAGLVPQGMALSGIAADGLKNGSGIESRTLHSRLAQWEQGRNLPGPKDVLVIDEAGMIGSRQMERILHFANEGRAKVVLVGDPEQLQAIEAGGAFRSLSGKFGAAKLETVRRQRAGWQQDATRELATGKTGAALDRYRDAGMEHRHVTGKDARAALVAQWAADRVASPQASRIVLAYNRADVADLNARARTVLREAGQLGPDVTLRTEAGKRSFAPGDRIYFLKNDAGLGVRNGSLATIKRIHNQTVVAQLDGDEGRTIMFGMAQYGHIDHGYAATVHKSQGVTVDRAYLLATKSLDRHAAYVAMTRHRDRLDIHWAEESFASRAKLTQTLSRAAPKDTSLDYDDTPDRPDPATIERRDRVQAQRRPRRKDDRAAPKQGRGAVEPETRPAEQTAEQAARQQSRDEAMARQLGEPAPRQIEGPRPSDPQPITILLTAEMMDYDRETVRLATAMNDRHQAEIAIENQSRAQLAASAALQWFEVKTQPAMPARDEFEEALQRRQARPLTPGLDR